MEPTAEPRIGRTLRIRPGKRKKDNDLRIFTWNVRTLYQPGKLKILLDELHKYKADITAIQEIRWTGQGIIEKRTHNVFYSGKNRGHVGGTAFIVRKEVKHLVIGFEAIDERMCKIRLRGKFFNYTIINIHAPTEDKPDEEKEIFYDALERAYRNSPRHDIKIIIGDANAKVGRETIFQPTIGKFSLHEQSNENGMRLINFAMGQNMVISSTKFQHKNIQKVTWRSPDGVTNNAIDHVLIDARHCSNVLDVRSYRGANIDSDHFLVGMKLRSRISAIKTRRGSGNINRKFNVARLKDEDVRIEYENQVSTRMNEGNNMSGDERPNETLNEQWNLMESAVKRTATDVIGFVQRERRTGWFDEECAEVTREKNIAYQTMLNRHRTRNAVEEYKEKRRVEKRVHKAKKRQFWENEIKRVEEAGNLNSTREFYKKVNQQRKEFKPRVVMCKNKNGEILSRKDDVLERWAEHFKEMLATSPEQEQNHSLNVHEDEVHEDIELPTSEEVRMAVRALKNNKAPGSDNIPAELVKQGGETVIQKLHEIIVKIWRCKEMPDEWNEGIICPLHKKGDPLSCSNYRGVTLLNIAYKVLSRILYCRLRPYAERILGNYQCGFRPGKSTTDQIFVLRQILEKAVEYNINIHMMFVDYKQAYDRIKREELYGAMEQFGFPKHLIQLTKMTMKEIRCRVKIDGELSPSFTTTRGLRQGDTLSCLLFNVALEKAVRDASINTSGCIFDRSVQLLAFADDIAILGRSFESMKEAFVSLERAAKNIGLEINEEKTKYLNTRGNRSSRQNVTIDEYNIEAIDDFLYLGTIITKDNDTSAEIKRRIFLASKCYFGLRKHMTSRNISKRTKLKLYTTLIRPVLLYGSETWTLKKIDESLLGRFERRILRTIYGGVQIEGVWRRRYNSELYERSRIPNIIKMIKIGRIRWIGHVERSSDENPAKMVIKKAVTGKRSAGRPKKRYMDDVEEDIRKLGIRGWRTRARDRDSWRKMLEEAKANNRLWSS